jgi:hypothetical protein
MNNDTLTKVIPTPPNASKSRIPEYENGEQWAGAMFKAGLAYHLEGDPADIIHFVTHEKVFTANECAELRAIVKRMPESDLTRYFERIMELMEQDYAPKPGVKVDDVLEDCTVQFGNTLLGILLGCAVVILALGFAVYMMMRGINGQ